MGQASVSGATGGFVHTFLRVILFVFVLSVIGGLAFAAGLAWSTQAHAAPRKAAKAARAGKSAPSASSGSAPAPRTVYPERTELDFEGLQLEGQMRNPGEFYFQHRKEEKFDSLVKRRKNFHREMLRDVVLSK